MPYEQNNRRKEREENQEKEGQIKQKTYMEIYQRNMHTILKSICNRARRRLNVIPTNAMPDGWPWWNLK